MTALAIASVLLGVISLDGVSGERLSARASFDANNVRVGDPMILTVDFVGTAEFSDLHPPALSREVDRKVWKVDDESAKTDTYLTARRLVYRVRPLKEGLLEFPALTFSYAGPAELGEAKTSTSPIPVHVKPGTQAALAGLDAEQEGLPMPDGIVLSVSERLGEDDLFRWRKACRSPTAAAFAQFDFPEAKLNEAACHIVEGNWAKALKVYSALEWRIGQTPAVERGIVAALARKHSSAAAELPVWRATFRPVLRMAWLGRTLSVLGFFLAAALAMWLFGRLVRVFACVAVLLAASQASAQGMDPFAEMDRMMQQAFGNINSMMGTRMTINGQEQPKVEVKASVALDKSDIQVGDTFEFVVSIETPRSASLGQLQLRPSEMFGMVVQGKVANLPDGKPSSPSNVVKRVSVPVRYDVPFKGTMNFTVSGMVSGRQLVGSGRNRVNYTFSQSFSVETPPIRVEIRPLPSDGQPADFSGAIGSDFRLRQSVDRNRVETNDVVTVTYVLEYSGYMPYGAVADELERRPGSIAWRRYFVADGSPSVPAESIVYYDTDSRKYKRAEAKGVRLSYFTESRDEAETVAVDAVGDHSGGKLLTLRFAPAESAPVVARVPRPERPEVLETSGAWARVECGGHAGWTRKGDLR